MVKQRKSLISRFRANRARKQKLKPPKHKVISGNRYKLDKSFDTKAKQTKRRKHWDNTPIGSSPNWSIRSVKVKGKYAVYMRHKDF